MLLLKSLVIFSCAQATHAFVEGLYCGRKSCYEVLDVTRDSTKQEISKAYRKLALKHHPDKVKGSKEQKAEAQKQFQLIATAYETLKDEEARNDYDYMLDNPEEMYRHYWYYYRRRLSPKVDVRIVILVAILAVSVVQYISAYQKYNEAISYLMTDAKYRHKALAIAIERGLIEEGQRKGKSRAKKEELKEREEAVIKEIIEENVDIHGGYGRPSLKNVVAVRIVLLPLSVLNFMRFHVRWLWRFTICREEYGDEERQYLIRRNLGMSETQFKAVEEKERDTFIKQELWKKDNAAKWKRAREDEERQKLLERGSYKRYQRMQRKGVGQISFLDDE